MNGARFKWPPLSDSCAAQKWLVAHRIALVHFEDVAVPRWRFEDGSVLTDRNGQLYAVYGATADAIVRRRARRRACWRAWRVMWQRRPIWGDHEARRQYRAYVRALETMFWGGWA